jgi:hypothetical protein
MRQRARNASLGLNKGKIKSYVTAVQVIDAAAPLIKRGTSLRLYC